MTAKRSFLFLQGGSSPLFRHLGDSLAADGHDIFRINFNGGDRAYWGARPCVNFRGLLDELPEFYAGVFRSRAITDVILYSDRRPVHVPGIKLARELGLRIHVFEEGYFRPFFLTLERGGVNGNSALPKDPDWYRRVGRDLPEHPGAGPFAHGFRSRARHDIAYEVANLANPLLFPRYRTHVPYNRWLGYGAHLRRLAAFPFRLRRDQALITRLEQGQLPMFLLPLQLESDAQIRYYSSFTSMAELIRMTITSFARHAPDDSRLVIKNHPLDPGFIDYGALVTRLAREHGVAARTDYVDTGDASALVPRARGVITVNSTVGMAALLQQRPVIALGTAIYNLPGLTYQGSLDAFWRETPEPDNELFHRFRKVVIHTTQLRGGFYTAEGIKLAVANSREWLLAERSPLEQLQ